MKNPSATGGFFLLNFVIFAYFGVFMYKGNLLLKKKECTFAQGGSYSLIGN